MKFSMPNRWGTGWLCGLLITGNVAAWGWAWLAFAPNPMLLASALLAYTFGLRHAVDADHIAAIDNATRKLVEAGQGARTTGLFFSLGHATLVILAVVGIALFSARFDAAFSGLQSFASVLSTGFSAVCLFALAIANSAILVSVCRLFAGMRQGRRSIESELGNLLSRRGFVGRLLRGLFRLISKGWHMYPLGFLFGLGFDTASEIGLLGVSAAQASHGLPLTRIMVFPALFTAGMVLLDTLDGIMMAGAYRWAAAQPLRKLRYNLAITSISIVIAVVIGGIELLGLFAGKASPTSLLSPVVAGLNNHSAAIGSAVIGACATAWLLSGLIWRLRSAASQRAMRIMATRPFPFGKRESSPL